MKLQKLFDLFETYANKKIILTNINDEQVTQFALSDVSCLVFTMKHNPDAVTSAKSVKKSKWKLRY